MNPENDIKKVFVIDSDPNFQQMMELGLNKGNQYQVKSFLSADDVLNNNLESPDIMIIDLYLRGTSMSGHEALTKFENRFPNCKFFLVSGEEDVALLEDYERFRGVSFFLKTSSGQANLYTNLRISA